MRKSARPDERRPLAKRLGELRHEAGVTQIELASQIGVSRSFVMEYESGKRRLDLIQLRDLRRALDVRLSSLAGELE